jgi:hypothetical protein
VESTIFEELALKSLYFLAMMRIADDDLERAISTLNNLKERGGDYGKRAEELLKEVGKTMEPTEY